MHAATSEASITGILSATPSLKKPHAWVSASSIGNWTFSPPSPSVPDGHYACWLTKTWCSSHMASSHGFINPRSNTSTRQDMVRRRPWARCRTSTAEARPANRSMDSRPVMLSFLLTDPQRGVNAGYICCLDGAVDSAVEAAFDPCREDKQLSSHKPTATTPDRHGIAKAITIGDRTNPLPVNEKVRVVAAHMVTRGPQPRA